MIASEDTERTRDRTEDETESNALAETIQNAVMEVINNHDWADWDDPALTSAHSTHHYDGMCAVCRNQWNRVAQQIAEAVTGHTPN